MHIHDINYSKERKIIKHIYICVYLYICFLSFAIGRMMHLAERDRDRERESEKSPPEGMTILQPLLLHSPLRILGMNTHTRHGSKVIRSRAQPAELAMR